MDAWMITWCIAILFLFLLSPVATGIKFLIERCCAIPLRDDEGEEVVIASKDKQLRDF
jgi:hypothetical protein